MARCTMLDGDGRPLNLIWRYDRSEIIADAIVHAFGIGLASIGAVAIVALAAASSSVVELGAIVVYATGLVSLLSVSAAYNLWPVSRTKWLLRRLDHALIFVLIAATYTPFVSRMEPGPVTVALLVGVWSVALFGAALKIALPGRFDKLSIVLCLLLGGSGALAWDAVSRALPSSTLVLMIAGALVYATGVIFHVWDSLRYQNAVWHSFVLVASGLFYSAVLDGVVLA